jgi:hypothetical protein
MSENLQFTKENLNYGGLIRRVTSDIPPLGELWNPTIESNRHINPVSKAYLYSLNKYIISLQVACEQGLYAIDCLKGFSSHESSNITEFYVAYYLYDFITRVKTGTDLLALIINSLYHLDMREKQCSLENGTLSSRLRNKTIIKKVEKLAREIDRARTGWLGTFDILRDFAIHRLEFTLVLVGNLEFPVHIQIPIPFSMFNKPIPINKNRPLDAFKGFEKDNPLLEFLMKIRSESPSEYLTCDPIVLCEEIWKELSKTICNILDLCKEDIYDFYNSINDA